MIADSLLIKCIDLADRTLSAVSICALSRPRYNIQIHFVLTSMMFRYLFLSSILISLQFVFTFKSSSDLYFHLLL